MYPLDQVLRSDTYCRLRAIQKSCNAEKIRLIWNSGDERLKSKNKGGDNLYVGKEGDESAPCTRPIQRRVHDGWNAEKYAVKIRFRQLERFDLGPMSYSLCNDGVREQTKTDTIQVRARHRIPCDDSKGSEDYDWKASPWKGETSHQVRTMNEKSEIIVTCSLYRTITRTRRCHPEAWNCASCLAPCYCIHCGGGVEVSGWGRGEPSPHIYYVQ